MRRVVFTLVSALCANVAIAAPLTQSLRPVARPVAIEPELSQPDVQSGPAQSLRPKLRPPHIEKALAKRAALLAKGAVCGDIAIQGETIGRVSAKRSGCGVNDAVKVSSISGVALSQKSIMDCKTASALKKLIDDGAKKSSEPKVADWLRCKSWGIIPVGTETIKKAARSLNMAAGARLILAHSN